MSELKLNIVESWQIDPSAEPDNLEARWKLLRAIQFHGDHVLVDRDERRALYERSRLIADATRSLLGLDLDEMKPEEAANILRGVPDAAAVYLQSAIHWGLWGQTTGKMKALRSGVAGKLRDFAQVVILLDERLDDAGGHRFMGRLHSEAPRIPLVTGWIDRRRAVAELERACELAPEAPYNQLYLADALLRFQDERRSEALDRLETLIRTPPRPELLIEDMAVVHDARALLTRQRRE